MRGLTYSSQFIVPSPHTTEEGKGVLYQVWEEETAPAQPVTEDRGSV